MCKILLMSPVKNNIYVAIPNIGLGYVAEATLRVGHEVTWLDLFHGWNDEIIFKKYIKNNSFDIIGISFLSCGLEAAKKCINMIREIDKKVIIVIGGVHPTLKPVMCQHMMPEVDYIVFGEGEEAFPRLLKAIETHQTNPNTLCLIDNLIWRHEGKWITNNRKYIDDLDQIGSPAWEIIKPQYYNLAPNGIFSRRRKIAPIITSRGCKYRCTFCAATKISGGRIRRRSVTNVIEEIKTLSSRFGIREIHIMDDSFAAEKEYVLDFCNALINECPKTDWACPNGLRLDSLDEEMIISMEKAGCYSFSVGIESGSRRILDLMNKKLSLEVIREKVSLIKRVSNIEITGFFILGFPSETEKEIEQTISFSKELGLDKANFFNFTPFPGSKISDKLESEGRINNFDYEDYYIHNVFESFCKASRSRLIALQRIAHIQFYYDFKKLFRLAKEIKSFVQIKIIFRRILKIMFQS